MPNISILEQDLTMDKDSSTTANVVYVPGYSIMGPANEPVLCSSLAEFKKIFGPVPYTFKKPQSVAGRKFTTAGDYEKSYIYAAELVNSGLPILFERITTNDRKASYTFNVMIKGLVASTYSTSVETSPESHVPVEYTLGEITKESESEFNSYLCEITYETPANITVSLAEGVNEEDVYDISFNEGVISFKSQSNIDITSENISQYLVISAIRNIPATYATVTYGATINFEDNDFVAHATVDGVENNNLEARIDFDTNKVSIYSSHNEDATLITKLNLLVNDSSAQFNSNLIVKAKYSGAYGKNITVRFIPNIVDGKTYYDLYVHQLIGSVEQSEIKTISFDETDEKYYFENIEFDLVDLEMPEFNYSFEMAKRDLLTVANSESDISLIMNDDGSEDEFNVNTFYDRLNNSDSVFDKLTDRDLYQIKFITSGGYPVYNVGYENIITKMLQAAANRGDCLALIDHNDLINVTPENMFNNLKQELAVKIIANNGEDAKKYGAMFTPWGKYKLNVINGVSAFPGSYAYLRCLSASAKTNANWLAIAGATRGQVPDLLGLNNRITGALAEDFQVRKGISINPIIKINPYGYCIWGNRTLFNNINDLTASSSINIRMLSNDVKKVVYAAAKKLTFELSSDILWLNFKSAIEPTLDQMVSGSGLTNYKVIKVPTDKRATIACKIKLFAVDVVEDWDVTVELSDGNTSVN